jgi:hypothetical protein
MTNFALNDTRGAGEGRVGRRLVAFEIDKRDIVGGFVPNGRSARLCRILCRDDGGQSLVLDLDQLGRVRRLMTGLGDDKRDVVADPADPRGNRPNYRIDAGICRDAFNNAL